MVFGLFEKEETTEDIADHLTPSPSKPSSPPEAAITAWCRKNRASSGTAQLFFEMADGGMPLFSSDGEAMSWLSERAESDPSCSAVLGLMFEEGLGVARSDSEAAEWYRRAAEQGNPDAQFSLGAMHEDGRGGVPQSDSQAVAWYRRAADQGSAMAQCSLGVMYENGRGVPKSGSEAVAWYTRAAAQGDEDAEAALSRLRNPS